MPEAIQYVLSHHKEMTSSTKSNRAKYSEQEVRQIRLYKKQGMICRQCNKKYFPYIPETSFKKI